MTRQITHDAKRNNDGQYYETYRAYLSRLERERNARKRGVPVEQLRERGPRKRKLSNGTVIDDAFLSRFRKLYATAMSMKQIARELDCAVNMPYKLARELNLPVRQHRGVNKRKLRLTVSVNLQIDKALWRALDTKVKGKYRSKQTYIEALLRRELLS